uniref:R3H domain-containing protein n=1 Tax=Wrangelia sp. TaxID=2575620 RepID=A0A4D6WYV7_9FLOR|nr:hypothetical protein [Wrangelia sp.]
MLIADDLDKLLEILPDFVKNPLENHRQKKYLIEIVMDLGRRPEARFPNGPEYLSKTIISWHDLDFTIKRIGHFSGDNRAGIECTLHRISSIKNRQGTIVGLTCRVGRAIFGTIGIIRDLLEKGQSLLLLGRPGVGKTTAIREIARVLADEMEKRVVIIDTSNEIAGDGDIPHPAIGRARRMQVSKPELQHQVMIEAVENHMPEVIIIDEIGTELEALAARTIAERGVQLVGTVHGNYLESLIKNPMLSDLIGGIQYVTLGDDEAKRRGSQKSVLERKSLPAFQVAIEIHQRYSWIVHEKVDKTVDQILQGDTLLLQRRELNESGLLCIKCEIFHPTNFMFQNKNSENNTHLKIKKKQNNFVNSFFHANNLLPNSLNSINTCNASNDIHNMFTHSISNNSILLYSYGLNNELVDTIISTLQCNILLTTDVMKSNIILTLRSNIKNHTKIKQIAKARQITIYTINSSTFSNITRALKQMLSIHNTKNINWINLYKNRNFLEIQSLLEVYFAIHHILIIQKHSVELLPRISTIRKIQYDLISSYSLTARSFGEEPNRRLRIYPN